MKPTSVNSGSLSWHELTASSSKEAMAFYSQVFGWKFKTIVVAHAPYHIIINDGVDIGSEEILFSYILSATIAMHLSPFVNQ